MVGPLGSKFIRASLRARFAEARGDKAGSQDPLAGAPAYDFLTGAGGFAQVFTYGLTGFRWRSDRVHLDPMLPPQLSGGVTLKGVQWQGRTFDVEIGPNTTKVTLRTAPRSPWRPPPARKPPADR